MKVSKIKYTPPPKIPLTKEAYEENVQKKRELLKERKLVIGRLQVAREMGDLSENGAYQYTKFELGNIGRQLKKLNNLIHNGEVVEKNSATDSIEFGHTITLLNQSRKVTYTLVSEHESDPMKGKLSYTSPIGKALLGKKGSHTSKI